MEFDLDGIDEPAEGVGGDDRSPLLRTINGMGTKLSSYATVGGVASDVSDVMPDQFTPHLESFERVKENIEKDVEKFTKEAKPHLQGMIGSAKAILPEGRLRNAVKGLETRLGLERDSGFSQAGPSEDQIVESKVADIFGAKAIEDGRNRETDKAQEALRDVKSDKQHIQTATLLASMKNDFGDIAKYTTGVNSQFQRKSLELMLKQQIIQKKLYEATVTNNANQKVQLETIVKNTGLPDFLKMNSGEYYDEMYIAKLNEAKINAIFGNFGFITKVGAGLREAAGNKIRGAIDGMESAAEMGEQIKEGIEANEDLKEMGAAPISKEQLLGGLVVDKAKGVLKSKLQDKLQDAMDSNKDSKIIDGIYSKLVMLNSAPEYLREELGKGNDIEDDDGFMAKAYKHIRGIGADAVANASIGDVSLAGVDYNKSANVTYDGPSHRSIVHVIPGLLSRILRETQIIRTGDENVPMISWDIRTSSFKTDVQKDNIAKMQVKNALNIREDGTNPMNDVADDIVNILNDEDNLSQEEKDILSQFLMKDALRKARGKAGVYNIGGFKKDSVRSLMSADELSVVDKLSLNMTNKEDYEFTEKLNRLGETPGQVQNIIQLLESEGYGKHLDKFGITSGGVGSRSISIDKHTDFLLGNDTIDYDVITDDEHGAVGLANQQPTSRGGLFNRNKRPAIDTKSIEKLLERTGESLGVLNNIHDKIPAPSSSSVYESHLDTITSILKDIRDKPSVTLSGKTGGAEDDFIRFQGGMLSKKSMLGRLVTGTSWALGKTKDAVTGTSSKILEKTLGIGKSMFDGSGSVLGSMKDGLSKFMSSGFEMLSDSTNWISGKLSGLLDTQLSPWLSNAYEAVKNIFKGGKDLFNKVTNFVFNGPMDIYVAGNPDEPVLYRSHMKLGNIYFRKSDGEPIRGIEDIDSEVVDSEGEIILSMEMMEKGLFTSNGTDITSTFGPIKNLVKTYIDHGRTAAKWVGGKYTQAKEFLIKQRVSLGKKLLGVKDMDVNLDKAKEYASSGYSKLKDSLADGRDALIGSGNIIEVTLNTGYRQIHWLKRIYMLLDKRMGRKIGNDEDNDGFADGTWKDLINNKSAILGPDGKPLSKESVGNKAKKFGDKLSSRAKDALDRIPGAPTWIGSVMETMGGYLETIIAILGAGAVAKLGLGRGKESSRRKAARKRLKGMKRAKKTSKMKAMMGELLGEFGIGEGLSDVTDSYGESKDRTKRKARIAKRRLTRSVSRRAKQMSNVAKGGRAALAATRVGVGLASAGASAGAVASSIGGVAMGVGGVVGSVIGTTFAVLTSPVVLTGAALVAAGVGSYYAYKWFTKNDSNPILDIRLRQYGLGSDMEEYYSRIFALEKKLESLVKVTGSGLDIKAMREFDGLETADIMGFNASNQADASMFKQWFDNRFLPVFTVHIAALNVVQSGMSILDADDLDEVKKVSYINKTRFSNGPYSLRSSPFPGYPLLSANASDVNAAIEAALPVLDKGQSTKLASVLESEANDIDDNVDTEKERKEWIYRNNKLIETNNESVNSYFGTGGKFDSYFSGGERVSVSNKTTLTNRGRGRHNVNTDPSIIPDPRKSIHAKASEKVVTAVRKIVEEGVSIANRYGFDIDADTVMVTLAQESNFVSKAHAPVGTAAGIGQFVTGTWTEVLGRYGKRYNVHPSSSRYDARSSILMAIAYMTETSTYIKKHAKGLHGKRLTPVHYYLGHFMGAGGAVWFLNGMYDTPDNPVSLDKRLRRSIKANPAIFKRKGKINSYLVTWARLEYLLKSKALTYGIPWRGDDVEKIEVDKNAFTEETLNRMSSEEKALMNSLEKGEDNLSQAKSYIDNIEPDNNTTAPPQVVSSSGGVGSQYTNANKEHGEAMIVRDKQVILLEKIAGHLSGIETRANGLERDRKVLLNKTAPLSVNEVAEATKSSSVLEDIILPPDSYGLT